jgi:hypothetical protein
MDVTVNNAVNTYTLNPSTYTSASSIGRGTVTLTNPNNTYTLAYYFVSTNKLYAVEIDGGALQGGFIELQNGSNFNNNWASGPFVLQLERGEIFGAFGMAGEWKFDGIGHVTSGVQDEYATGILTKDITINSGSTYNFDISGSGRGVVNEQTSSGSRSFTFYMVSTSKMYLLRTDPGNNTEIGVAETQENPPFSPSSVSGIYGFVTVLLDAGMQNSEVGVLVADGNGNISGIKDSNMSGNLSSTSVSGSYSIANGTQDGRGTNILIAPSATTQQNLIIYVVSGSKVVSVETGPALDGWAVLQ